jgi:hypothetical protein
VSVIVGNEKLTHGDIVQRYRKSFFGPGRHPLFFCLHYFRRTVFPKNRHTLIENVVSKGVRRESRNDCDAPNNSRKRTRHANWPNNRHVRHGYYQPNQVHRYNQHAHGTGEGMGSSGFSCLVEPSHKKEQAERKKTDQQEEMSLEDLSQLFTPYAAAVDCDSSGI